ncbi:hypothetical protein O5O45_28135 [Hahella aquimaris]|uniref:PKD domain-containing protein n=1 Tax=Hahella sp. HNIBRBA332 TaxID=3015983 RepID=UPI00273C5C7B|nr:PKD domain-containing protein [Hahella sp. HNIBRBA332]WLQ13602.1 hypothetical protein O5O45_28135 [Hahella sp. HNIBRBA332]
MGSKTNARVKVLSLMALTAIFTAGCSGDNASSNDANSPGGSSPGNENPPAQENTPPVAAFAMPSSSLLGGVVELDASASYDADNDTLSYQWELIKPDTSSSQLSADKQTAGFTPDVTGDYVVRLVVSDGASQTVISKTVHVLKAPDAYAIKIESASDAAQSDVPFTFAYVFKPGEFAADKAFSLTFKDSSQVVDLQTDVKATHSDGSIRHAVFSGTLASIGPRQTLTGSMAPRNADSRPAPVSLDALLNGSWNADFTVTVNGEVYSANAKDLLRQSATQWLAGPVANEWYAQGALKNSANEEHDQLSALFYVRVYGDLEHIRFGVVAENGWAFGDHPRNITYDSVIRQNTLELDRQTGLNHLRHARWSKFFWSDNEPAISISHNPQYLIATGAVPNFDPTLIENVSETKLDWYEQQWRDTQVTVAVDDNGYIVPVGSGGHEFTYNKIGPMGLGLAHPQMPTTGARPDIGPLPTWAAMYLLSQDQRAKLAAVQMGSQAGSYSIHYRDRLTGKPVSVDAYPYASTIWDKNLTKNPDTGEFENIARCDSDKISDCVLPYRADASHQPSLAYVPYLVTGDHLYLEELQFWANYNFIMLNPHYRGFSAGYFERAMQDRAQAWSMRTLAHAAYITPDADPFKNYFHSKLLGNIAKYNEKYLTAPPNGYGAMIPNYSYPTASPWMDDFFTWSLSAVVDLGYAEAADLLKWKAKFPIQRMGLGTDNGDDYCWIFASAYHLLAAPDKDSDMFASIAEVYQNTNGRDIPYGGAFDDKGTECGSIEQAEALGLQQGEMIGYSSSPAGFPSNLQIALAAAADSGADKGREAWEKFMARPVKPDYSAAPNYAIVPRY